MASLKDIAEEAGVHVSVVSRALNPAPDKNAYVSEETRAKIEIAAQELGFRRNRNAEFLKRGRSPAIGVFMPDGSDRLLCDLMLGISDRASELGFHMNIYTGMSYEKYKRFMAKAEEYTYSGIISYPVYRKKKQILKEINRYQKNGGKVVLLSSAEKIEDIPVLNIDDFYGGQNIAEYMLKKKCAAYFVEKRDFFEKLSLIAERQKGMLQKFQENGISPKVFTRENFEDTLLKYIKEEDRLPLGVLTVTDKSALIVMNIIKKYGLKIGSQILVSGYDNQLHTDIYDPPLTTVHQPFRELGYESVSILVDLMYDRKVNLKKIKPELIIRESA